MMVQRKSRKTLYTVLAVLLAILLIIAVVAIVKSFSNDPASDAVETSTESTPEITEEANNTKTPTSTVPEDSTEVATIDPELLSEVTIEPMTIIVSYMKGIEGFDFQVLRNPNGTQYVQFSATKLAGTKCTNDIGTFASIIQSPTADESATLTKTTTVSGTTYGLSLADSTCTADEASLKQYQDAFSQPFSLLKKI